MVTKRLTMRALAGLTLWAGFGLSAQAQLPAVTPESAFKVMPRQPGVNVTTPTPDQVPQCKVEPIPGKDGKPMGYVVRDPIGRAVRQFVSYDGKTFNIIAFYVNGVEAYRESYPPQPGDPFQFRWLGPNGTKWGLDRDRDGRVDEWAVISPEELTQELLAAILAKDVKRAEALVVTKSNLDGIGLPAGDSHKLLERAAAAGKRVADVAEALKLSSNAQWVQLGLASPQATAADAFNPPARDDVVMHRNGTVLVADGKDTKFLQTGEMVLIGRAWKLVDGPSTGMEAPGAGGGSSGGAPPVPKAIEALVAKLQEVDTSFPNSPTPEAIAAHNAKRVEILEQIVSRLEPKDQETWLKLLVDALAAAAEGEKADGKHIARLKQLREALAKGPSTTLAAYVGFRHLVAENSIAIAGANDQAGGFDVVQSKWRTNLEEFIKTYATSEEAPEAMLRLAMAYEYLKDGEPKAKEWYARLAKDYAQHPHAAKAAGAVKRLDSVGKPLELVGPNLADGKVFNAASLQGKVVVVYYFASWSRALAGDVQKLTALEKEYGPKGLVLVSVCLDNDARTAAQTIAAHKVPGTILHAPGGLDASPLASNYGIVVVPHVFVAGKDGKIVNRNAQATTVEEDVKKLLQ